MNPRRRALMTRLAGLSATGLGALAALPRELLGAAGSAEYRALVVVFLKGGNDGNDTLVPLDGGFDDYRRARPGLALPRSGVLALPGSPGGRRLGLNPALHELLPLYGRGRLAFVANAGPLVRPTTAAEVLDGRAVLPPFLFSHSEQVNTVQGWLGDDDPSGWGGRVIEAMPPALVGALPLVSLAQDYTLVLGRRSRLTQANSSFGQYWGPADLARPQDRWTQIVESMGLLQSRNRFEAEYARSLGASFQDSVALTQAQLAAREPQATFADTDIGRDLRYLASLLPVLKERGVRRQVILVEFGVFDTHTRQRSTVRADNGQDPQLAELGAALAAFDHALTAAGLDRQVTTWVTTEFGRTLNPASGGGTDHAWGNHWWVLGGAVQGGQVLGHFPALVKGGPDDGDRHQKGRWVPTTATDQVAASLARWLGLPDDKQTAVFPQLANFQTRTLPLIA